MAQHAERHWVQPSAVSSDPVLHLYNSAVDDKVPFIPQGGAGSKQVTWYTCGPTVYDVSHIGHARNYVTFDIIRRVLEDYFGYNVTFVMNITDVDDKIIFRARRNHLFDTYMQQKPSVSQLLSEASAAITAAVAKQEGKVVKARDAEAAAAASTDSRKAKDLTEQRKGEELKLAKLGETRAAIEAASAGDAAQLTIEEAAALVKETLSEKLDAEQGASVTDKGIYRAHAARYEHEFLEDMRALGVRDPDVMPRVSDYVPHIVAFISTIVAKGLAYEASGSVYFDVRAFQRAGHVYGKLKPWAVGSVELASESESNFTAGEKRSPQDFALWKASKPGEPTWDSPWGPGRPGWHIECSAMADAVLGRAMDIHSGGEDLKFPHHDNEIAQTLAYLHEPSPECSSCPCQLQWVNYWLHSGHLAIDGLKMSKSLKNFITIREALAEFSARQIRLLFCLSPWHRPMTFNQSSREEMVTKEATLKNFFQNIEVKLREHPIADISTSAPPADVQLLQDIEACEQSVHLALLDNVDTATAMARILDLVSAVNKYLSARDAAGERPAPLLLKKAARFVSRILSVFGLDGGDRTAFAAGGGESGADQAAAVLDAFSGFRDQLREFARSDAGKAAREPLMHMCDVLRDVRFVELGIRLEDKPSGSVWKRDDPATLKREIEEKRRAAADAAVKKVRTNLDIKRGERDKLLAVSECSLAQKLADKLRLDADEQPTHALQADGSWQELDDKQKKNAMKVVEKERKARAPAEKKLRENPGLIAELDQAVAALEAQLQQFADDGIE